MTKYLLHVPTSRLVLPLPPPIALVTGGFASRAVAEEPPQFRAKVFNGKDLTGWVNVNTDADTWTVRDGLLVCTGQPIGVMRSDKQYENFILHIEWRHMEPGGNSGVFIWVAAGNPQGAAAADGDGSPDARAGLKLHWLA